MIDIDKYRRISGYNKVRNSSLKNRDLTILQGIDDFAEYQKSAPNTEFIYINDDYNNPTVGTFLDVSELEIRLDTKWLLTPIDRPTFLGDIITCEGKKWLVIYDKDKSTGSCNKCKIQPCNYEVKIPMIIDGVPTIYKADTIMQTYLTDTKDFKQPFPTKSDTTFLQIQFNDITRKIKEDTRIWLFEKAYKLTGVDFTNVDHYTGNGIFKWTLRPDREDRDRDNFELGICDYYKYFNKNVDNITRNDSLVLQSESTNIGKNNVYIINAETLEDVEFVFDGFNSKCILRKLSNNTCELLTGNEIGIVKVKGYLKSNSDICGVIRFSIT